MKGLSLSLPLCLLLSACSEAATVDPVAQPSASATDAGLPPPPPPPPANTSLVKRTVMTRSPFGSRPGNYLVDGDFELSTLRHEGAQVGWRAFDATGSGTANIDTETGGLCYSGLRCAVLAPKTVLLLRGAAAGPKGTVASIVAKVPAGADCFAVSPILVTCDDDQVLKVLHANKAPASDGWCHYATDVPPQTFGTCIYVESNLNDGTTALLDDATMGPDDGTVVPKKGEITVPKAETLARLSNIRRLVRATMPVGRAPRGPTPFVP